MRGFATDAVHQPVLNPSWQNLSKARAPGWGINGPGVAAEWSQGGESEWNSAAAAADETNAVIYQDLEIPRAGDYQVWVRYADWANKAENFVIKITQEGREVFRHEFGARDVIDNHDEVSMYWGWTFTWDGARTSFAKGPARLSIAIEQAAAARRHVDCVLLTNDLAFVPEGRRKPDFAAARYLRESAKIGTSPAPLLAGPAPANIPPLWRRPKLAGRDFLMPWNIAREYWTLYDKPESERPLYPFSAEPIEEFLKKYNGAKEVPIFDSKLVIPVIYINDLPAYLKDGSSFRRYLRDTRAPFAVLINYGSAQMSESEGQSVWKLLNGELKDQFLGWISGESVGYVWEHSAKELKLTPDMSRPDLLAAHRVFYTNAIARKWAELFHTDTGAMWEKLIPAQATSSTSFAHALSEWGVRLLGVETAAVQPMFGMRIAFTRGAARQYGGAFLYYHAPNFGDTATTFTKAQNFAGPDYFYHSRYGPTMGPSLSWYRKSYYLYYMSGASAIYLEQGFDQFFKPGPGDQPFQLNPLGRITSEFMRFAEQHPDRGTPYTPVAFLLDPAHGWEMTDYPQWPFELSQINRSDRALRELFTTAYYPGGVVEGEPATGDRQAFVSGIFGDIFDVLVASKDSSPKSQGPGPRTELSSPRSQVPGPRTEDSGLKSQVPGPSEVSSPKPHVPGPRTEVPGLSSGFAGRTPAPGSEPGTWDLRLGTSSDAINSYRAIVVGGSIEWTSDWAQRLAAYVRNGGVVMLNAAQTKGLPFDFLGVRSLGVTGEAHNARCLSAGEAPQDLSGQIFRYQRVERKGSEVLIEALGGDPLVTVNKVGKGKVIFCAVPDLLGEDERMVPLGAHLIAHLLANATPIKVSGDVEYLINRTDTGWIVTLFNNNGILKPQQGLAQVDRSATVTATTSLAAPAAVSAREWLSEAQLTLVQQQGRSTATVKISPGGVAIVALTVPR